jgi:hypothetical protein
MQEWITDHDGGRIPRSSIELPPIHFPANDITSVPFPSLDPPPRTMLPSILSSSPPGRSSTLPPLHRPLPPNRPRKQSITKKSHKKQRSKGGANEWLKRLQNEGGGGDLLQIGGGPDRKALSAEPSADYGKRWEDLIDAAASATEDIDDDRTPVSSTKCPSA